MTSSKCIAIHDGNMMSLVAMEIYNQRGGDKSIPVHINNYETIDFRQVEECALFIENADDYQRVVIDQLIGLNAPELWKSSLHGKLPFSHNKIRFVPFYGYDALYRVVDLYNAGGPSLNGRLMKELINANSIHYASDDSVFTINQQVNFKKIENLIQENCFTQYLAEHISLNHHGGQLNGLEMGRGVTHHDIWFGENDRVFHAHIDKNTCTSVTDVTESIED